MYQTIDCCERLLAAIADGNPSAFHTQLQDLIDFLKSDEHVNQNFKQLHDAAKELATQAEEIPRDTSDKSTEHEEDIPDPVKQQAVVLSEGVCQCYLRSAGIDPDPLPGFDTESVTETIENFENKFDHVDTETFLWVVKAKSIVAQREPTDDVIDQLLEELDRLDTDRSKLEASRDGLEKAMERERKSNERAKRIDEKARNL